ncbi:hypothetical protein L917_15877, partial [Phytophthora nicotianae]
AILEAPDSISKSNDPTTTGKRKTGRPPKTKKKQQSKQPSILQFFSSPTKPSSS